MKKTNLLYTMVCSVHRVSAPHPVSVAVGARSVGP